MGKLTGLHGHQGVGIRGNGERFINFVVMRRDLSLLPSALCLSSIKFKR